jgi:hypothetical protein
LWFAESARIGSSSDLQSPERVRLAATLREHPMLAQAWPTAARAPGRRIALSRDARFATVSDGERLRLYEVATGSEVPLKLPPIGDRVLDIDANELQLLAVNGEESVLSWSVRSGEVLNLKHPGGITSAEFSPDGHLIFLAGKDNTARNFGSQNRELSFKP